MPGESEANDVLESLDGIGRRRCSVEVPVVWHAAFAVQGKALHGLRGEPITSPKQVRKELRS